MFAGTDILTWRKTKREDKRSVIEIECCVCRPLVKIEAYDIEARDALHVPDFIATVCRPVFKGLLCCLKKR